MTTTNNTCKKCGCEDSFMPSPAPCPTPVGCPTPQPCSEIFDARCVRYTGLPLSCTVGVQTFNAEPNPNPNPAGPIVNTNDTVAEALENVIDYFCNNTPVPLPEYTYEIGQYVASRGGVIAHRWLSTTAGGPPTAGTVQNYLVVDIVDLSTGAQWASINTNISNVESTWNGATNTTNLILAGFVSGITSGTAVVLCANSTNNGQTDWYLPAAYEMTTIWNNQFSVAIGLEQASGQNLVFGANYATSTEIDSNSSYWFVTLSGNSVSDVSMGGKGTPRYVRAIRKFSI